MLIRTSSKVVRAVISVMCGAGFALLLAVVAQELLFFVFHDRVRRDSLSQPWDVLVPVAYPIAWFLSSMVVWYALGLLLIDRKRRP